MYTLLQIHGTDDEITLIEVLEHVPALKDKTKLDAKVAAYNAKNTRKDKGSWTCAKILNKDSTNIPQKPSMVMWMTTDI